MDYPLLIAKNIKKTFLSPEPVEILKDVSLSVQSGEKVAIVGKSGEGKSTLLQILGTIDNPTGGTLTILGKERFNSNDKLRNHSLGFVFQSFHLMIDLTVIDNVLLPMQIARADTSPKSANYKKALHLLERVGLSHRVHFPCKKLSGGEKQRVSIARAFANDPSIIFADEPTGNLDHNSALEIQNLLFECTQEQKKALILVTHNEHLAKSCDSIYILEAGYLHQK